MHTFWPPEPVGEDEDGNPVYPEPGPAFTLKIITDEEQPPGPLRPVSRFPDGRVSEGIVVNIAPEEP